MIYKLKFFKLVFFSKIKRFFHRESIYHARGTHLISGYMGSGKTLFMTELINSVDSTKYFWIKEQQQFHLLLVC